MASNQPRLSISRTFQNDRNPKGKVFPFHLSIPRHLENKAVELHPSLPVRAEIVQAKNGQPKKYCVTAFCAESDREGDDPIKVPNLFWDRIDDDEVEVDLEVRVVPSETESAIREVNPRNLTALTEPETTTTAQFRASRRYEDMPVDDP